MKTKREMFRELLKIVPKDKIKNKNFQDTVFNIDFKDWNFSIFNFSSADFSSADFSYANFRYSNFSSSDFSYANFRYSNFSSTDFSSANFRYADFSSANFRYANFSYANFSYADFYSANFSYANFRYSNFSSTDFSSADFSYANFRYANFHSANFRYADFSSANFRYANFSSANFYSANFSYADLTYIINEVTFGLTINCPEEGSFIGYKKAQGKIVKLLILEDSKRSSATSYKCRASKVKVLEIDNGNLLEVKTDWHNSNLIYKVGETIEIKDFDNNRWNECSIGIHFFMSRKMAENY